MDTIKHKIESNSCIFYINENIYSKKVIMKTAYVFIDKFYIFFNYEKEGIISVEFRGKECISKKDLEKQVGEFNNELLNQALRIEILEDTKNIREIILARALHENAIELKNEESDEIIKKEVPTEINNSDDKDTLGIGVSWFDGKEG